MNMTVCRLYNVEVYRQEKIKPLIKYSKAFFNSESKQLDYRKFNTERCGTSEGWRKRKRKRERDKARERERDRERQIDRQTYTISQSFYFIACVEN